jgi:hypothetical protein
MKPELENKLLDILNWVDGTTKPSVDFIVEQTPLFIQELLTYNFYFSLTLFILSFLGAVGSILALYKIIKYLSKTNNAELFPPLVILLILPFTISIIGISHNLDWFKIKMAPRVYVVDYLRTELKK